MLYGVCSDLEILPHHHWLTSHHRSHWRRWIRWHRHSSIYYNYPWAQQQHPSDWGLKGVYWSMECELRNHSVVWTFEFHHSVFLRLYRMTVPSWYCMSYFKMCLVWPDSSELVFSTEAKRWKIFSQPMASHYPPIQTFALSVACLHLAVIPTAAQIWRLILLS